MYRFILLIIISTCCLLANTKEVHLKNGSVIRGEISEEVLDEYYMIEMNNGSKIKVELREITKIISDFNDFDPNYSELGITLISPGGLNLNTGYTFDSVGLMFTPGIFGFEFAGAFKISHKNSISHEIVVPLGYSSPGDEVFSYTGTVYKLWISGFQIAGGLLTGAGTVSNPQLYLQVGYVYRFI